MSLYINHIKVESERGVETYYYAFNDTSDEVLTPFRTALSEVVEIIPEKDLYYDRSLLLHDVNEDEYSASPVVVLTNENLELISDAFSKLTEDEEISLEQKMLLWRMNNFLDVALYTSGHSYHDLNSDELYMQALEWGFGDEVNEYMGDSSQFVEWVTEDVANRVYAMEAMDQVYPVSRRPNEDFAPAPGHRQITAAYLATKTKLAIGALYAAGVNGDDLAMNTATALNRLNLDY